MTFSVVVTGARPSNSKKNLISSHVKQPPKKSFRERRCGGQDTVWRSGDHALKYHVQKPVERGTGKPNGFKKFKGFVRKMTDLQENRGIYTFCTLTNFVGHIVLNF
jgi:hypothetical protein